jgi:hypothetical protein
MPIGIWYNPLPPMAEKWFSCFLNTNHFPMKAFEAKVLKAFCFVKNGFHCKIIWLYEYCRIYLRKKSYYIIQNHEIMEQQKLKKGFKQILPVTIMLIVLTVLVSAFDQDSTTNNNQQKPMQQQLDEDTTKPKKKTAKAHGNISVRIDGLENLSAQLTDLLKDLSVELPELSTELTKALKEIDNEKINEEIDKAMKEVKNVDWSKIKKDIDEAMQELNKQDFVKIKVDMDNLKDELNKMKLNLNVDLGKMKFDFSEAKKELKKFAEMMKEMKADGLIKKGEPINIQWKKGELFINEQQQPANIRDKYKKYFGDEDFRFKMNEKEEKGEEI